MALEGQCEASRPVPPPPVIPVSPGSVAGSRGPGEGFSGQQDQPPSHSPGQEGRGQDWPEVTHSTSRCWLSTRTQEYSPIHLCAPRARSEAPGVTGVQSDGGLDSSPGFLVARLCLLPREATARVPHKETFCKRLLTKG